MPKTVLLDEWHLTFRIPATLPDTDVRAVRRVLTGKAFTAALRRAVLAVLNMYQVMTAVRVSVAR